MMSIFDDRCRNIVWFDSYCMTEGASRRPRLAGGESPYRLPPSGLLFEFPETIT